MTSRDMAILQGARAFEVQMPLDRPLNERGAARRSQIDPGVRSQGRFRRPGSREQSDVSRIFEDSDALRFGLVRSSLRRRDSLASRRDQGV